MVEKDEPFAPLKILKVVLVFEIFGDLIFGTLRTLILGGL